MPGGPAPRLLLLSQYRELLRLIRRLPAAKVDAALKQARETTRARRGEANPEQAQQHAKELAARIGFLRITTPRQPGEVLGSGRFVLRDGELVQGAGNSKGER